MLAPLRSFKTHATRESSRSLPRRGHFDLFDFQRSSLDWAPKSLKEEDKVLLAQGELAKCLVVVVNCLWEVKKGKRWFCVNLLFFFGGPYYDRPFGRYFSFVLGF